MPDTCVWTGASGKTYTFHVHALPVTFNPNQDGNYIFAKIVNNTWVPIYFGEGDLRDRVSDNHHKAGCIAKFGATHVHAHLNLAATSRTSEESDLLANYPNAYWPNGCNDKPGG